MRWRIALGNLKALIDKLPHAQVYKKESERLSGLFEKYIGEAQDSYTRMSQVAQPGDNAFEAEQQSALAAISEARHADKLWSQHISSATEAAMTLSLRVLTEAKEMRKKTRYSPTERGGYRPPCTP